MDGVDRGDRVDAVLPRIGVAEGVGIHAGLCLRKQAIGWQKS